MPLLGMEKAAMIALSTPLSEDNFFSKMLTYKDANGDFYFKTIHIGLICDECAKKPDLMQQIQCTHKEHELPQWKAGWRQARLKEISLKFDSAGRNARENMAGIKDDRDKSFNRLEIEDLFSRNPEIKKNYTISKDPSVIIVAIDPNAGGSSETAIVSGYFVYETNNATTFTGVILGIDAERTTDIVSQESLVVGHIKTLIQRFPRKRIIVVPENMTGFFHQMVEGWVAGMRDVQVLYQNGKEKAGVRKDAVMTRNYEQCVQEALAQKAIKFDSNWFTNSIPVSSNASERTNTDYYLNNIKDGLKEELLRYGRDETGKLTGKIKNTTFSDDKAIAFMMFLYWGRTILTNVPNNPYLELVPKEAHLLLKIQGVRPSLRGAKL